MSYSLRPARVFNDVLVLLAIAIALFGLVNWIAYIALATAPAQVPPFSVFSKVEWPQSDIGKAAFREIFGEARAEEALRRYGFSPGFAVHPNLHYMTAPTRNGHFTMGREGIRYEPGWTDEIIGARLNSGQGLVFIFGGSTLLGHGLSDDETIPYYMNRLIETHGLIALNFGSQAYDQRRQLEKLVYLLLAGYQPRSVVFFDGWNDILVQPRSNLRRPDKIVYHGFSAANRGEIAFTPTGFLDDRSHLRLFLESLPVYRWLMQREYEALTIDNVVWGRDSFVNGFDFQEAAFVHRRWVEFAEARTENLVGQLLDTHRANLGFLNSLGKAFGFSVHVFYQPLGILDSRNPFVLPGAEAAPGYRYIAAANSAVRAAIAVGSLPATDLSDALNDVDGPRYIDATHYSPPSNRRLAEAIVRLLDISK